MRAFVRPLPFSLSEEGSDEAMSYQDLGAILRLNCWEVRTEAVSSLLPQSRQEVTWHRLLLSTGL